MKTLYDVEAGKYLDALAEKLRGMKEFEQPEWARYVKTSASRTRPPFEEGWWLKRAASILRQVYLRGMLGVGRLKTKYGGRKERGAKPDHFHKGSGKIIRTILQQAEKAGFLEKIKDKKAGRKLTKKGKEFLDSVAEEAK